MHPTRRLDLCLLLCVLVFDSSPAGRQILAVLHQADMGHNELHWVREDQLPSRHQDSLGAITITMETDICISSLDMCTSSQICEGGRAQANKMAAQFAAFSGQESCMH